MNTASIGTAISNFIEPREGTMSEKSLAILLAIEIAPLLFEYKLDVDTFINAIKHNHKEL